MIGFLHTRPCFRSGRLLRWSRRNRLLPRCSGCRDGPDGSGNVYGTSLYNDNQAAFNNTVQISTPLTADRAGNVFFGFTVTGSIPLVWLAESPRLLLVAPGQRGIADRRQFGQSDCSQLRAGAQQRSAYRLCRGFDRRWIRNRLSDFPERGHAVADSPRPVARSARRAGDHLHLASSATPMVGPDGDVYFGVLEAPCCTSHNARGWMLHFDSTLTQTKTPGSFGWDDTASVVASGYRAVTSMQERLPI